MFKFFKRKIKLESFEVRIIINSLKVMRNKLIENNEDAEYVDEIIKIANLANVDAYQYINKLCYEYCEILKPY